MPITIEEKVESRSTSAGSSPSITFVYLIDGTNSESDALNTVYASTSSSYYWDGRFLRRDTISIAPLEGSDPLFTEKWVAEVVYNNKDDSTDPLTPSKPSFTISGETYNKKLTEATVDKQSWDLKTQQQVEGAPDNKGFIGVTPDGTVLGVDILQPVLVENRSKFYDADDVDAAFKKNLRDLVGKINEEEFIGYEPGEVRFDGVQGRHVDDTRMELSFAFAIRPRQEEVKIGPANAQITLEVVEGWDYVWVMPRAVTDEFAGVKTTVQYPKSAYTESVYKPGDFSVLEIDE